MIGIPSVSSSVGNKNKSQPPKASLIYFWSTWPAKVKLGSFVSTACLASGVAAAKGLDPNHINL